MTNWIHQAENNHSEVKHSQKEWNLKDPVIEISVFKVVKGENSYFNNEY